MEGTITEITAMSSRGQIVLPKMIRDAMSLREGAKLMVFADGDNILLKPIKAPDKSEFSYLMKEAEKWAQEVGMEESDISEAVKAVRKRKKTV